MSMPTIKPKALADAEPHELRAYVTTFLNLDMTGSESDSDIFAMIERAQPGLSTIFVTEIEDSDEPVTGAYDLIAADDQVAVDRIAGSLGRADPRVMIHIPMTGEDTIGTSDVGVGVNGTIWQIKRGVDVKVPWRVVEALGLTLQDIIRHNLDTDTVIITQAMRFPLQFPEGKPSKDVIDAWHKATDNAFCP